MRRSQLIFIAVLVAVVGSPATVVAHELCVPQAAGVPYTKLDHPKWWSGTYPDGMVWTDPAYDDPNWLGAVQHADEFRLRMLRDEMQLGASESEGSFMFLSLDEVMPETDMNSAYLWFGAATITNESDVNSSGTVQNPNCIGQVVYRIDLASVDSSGFVQGVKKYKRTSDGSDGFKIYDEVSGACPYVPKMIKRLAAMRWQLVVQLPPSPPDTLKFFVAATHDIGSLSLNASWPPKLPAPWAAGEASTVLRVPPLADWGELKKDGCGQQLAIVTRDIGVYQAGAVPNMKPGESVTGATVIKTTEENTLVARVRGAQSLMKPKLDSLKARFRLAGWGSSPVPDSSQPEVDSGDWQPAGDCDKVSIEGNVLENGLRRFSCSWSPLSLPTGWTNHQCMLVELTGEEVTFSSDSAYKNMDFAAASVVSRKARVSTLGLSKLGRPSREMLFHVRTTNLEPADRDTLHDPLNRMIGRLDARASGLTRLPSDVDAKQQPLPSAVGQEVALLSALRASAQDPATPLSTLFMQLGQLPQSTLDRLIPTIVVDVFHESAEVNVGNGKTRKIFRRQPSFGLNLMHKGAIHGWVHQLVDDDGAVLTALTGYPDWYHLSWPDNGTKHLKLEVATVDDIGTNPFEEREADAGVDDGAKPQTSGPLAAGGTGPCGHCMMAPPAVASDTDLWWIVFPPLLWACAFGWRRRRARG